MQIQLDPARFHRAFARAKIIAVLLIVFAFTAGCAAAAPSVSANGIEPANVVTVEVPVTVEVTPETVRGIVPPSTPNPHGPCAPARYDETNEITIGVLMPSSVPNSLPTTLAAQSGLTLALEEWRRQTPIGFPQIRLWWSDHANDPSLGAALAEEAITRQCAVALISASNSDTNAAIDAVAQRLSIPLIVVDGMDDALTAGQSANLFRLTPSNSMVAHAYAGWMQAVGDYNGDGVTHATLIIENSDWAKLQAQLIADAMTAKQIDVEAYPVDLPTTDFSSLIARLVVKSALPDVIFVRLAGGTGIQLQRQLLENGVGPTRKSLIVTAQTMNEMPAFWSALGENGAWGVIVRGGAWHGTVDEAARPFIDEYTRLFGRWPEMTAFAAHDALLLLINAMQRAESLSGNDLIVALEETDINLAGGHYTFGAAPADSATPEPWMWHQWLGQPILFMQLTSPYQALDDAVVLWPPAYAATASAYLRPEQ